MDEEEGVPEYDVVSCRRADAPGANSPALITIEGPALFPGKLVSMSSSEGMSMTSGFCLARSSARLARRSRRLSSRARSRSGSES